MTEYDVGMSEFLMSFLNVRLRFVCFQLTGQFKAV